jgi:methylglutaconyl-CoA hydratase
MSDTTNPVVIERRGAVAHLRLNRPELRNAFDDALIAALSDALAQLAADPSVRALVLEGSGSAFCAGADLNWMKRMAGYTRAQNYEDALGLANMLALLARFPKPTIARVHGAAFAGGVGLVAACDIALATANASFCLTEVKLGLSPATISPYVIRAIGERAARRYMLTAERFGAQEAHRLGLVSEVLPAGDTAALDARIAALLDELLSGGAGAQREIKQLIDAVAGRPVDDDVIRDTARRIAEIRITEEGREGIAAFLGKRRPAWLAPAPNGKP